MVLFIRLRIKVPLAPPQKKSRWVYKREGKGVEKEKKKQIEERR